MKVNPAHAAGSSEYSGTTYDFCSPSCKKRFDANPSQFLHGSVAAEPHMHELDVTIGDCPRCAVTIPAAPAGTKVEWTCPMHPEIVRGQPGSCPICGMALEPRTITLGEQQNPELRDMTRRFWFSAALSLPLLVITAIYLLWRGRDLRDLPHPEREADEQPKHHWWRRQVPVSGVLVPIPSREQKGRP